MQDGTHGATAGKEQKNSRLPMAQSAVRSQYHDRIIRRTISMPIPSRTYYTAPISKAEKKEFEPFLNHLVDTAFSVIMPKFLSNIAIEDKENGTPVTAADKAAEEKMRELIESNFPEHGIFGEEWGIKRARGNGTVRYRWILDPIDGTRSFITNSFLFGTLIALERDDGAGFRPVLSAIAHAAANVRVIGSREGTVLRLDNRWNSFSRPASVRECTNLSEATLLTTSHWTCSEQKGDARMQKLIDSVKLYRTMGDCFGYFAVATGGADIMVDPDLSYWDVAALLPVIEGAGGMLTSLTGGNPLEELSAVASAGQIHGEVLGLLQGA
jgi:myo-inositol-1(or 4)-monophosphatase